MVGITKMKAEKQKAEKGAFFCTTKELSQAWPGTDSDTVSVT